MWLDWTALNRKINQAAAAVAAVTVASSRDFFLLLSKSFHATNCFFFAYN